MAMTKYFDHCPEFPSDVPIADVPTVEYDALHRNDPEARSKLFRACREYGFFLLDLTSHRDSLSAGQVLLQDAENMFDLSEDTFNLDHDVLEKFAYQPPRNLNGYKSIGKHKVDGGYADNNRIFMIGQDDVLGYSQTLPTYPSTIESRKQQCRDFCLHAHDVVLTILTNLDEPLGLAAGTLASLCSLEKRSDTGVRMLRYYPEAVAAGQKVTLGSHTDMGTITVLFNVVGGLQILPADTENLDANWLYIRPRPNCAIINIGDTLVKWTGEILRSSLHRVTAPPGAQANAVRRSLAYLVRAPKDGSMQRLKGSNVIPPLPADAVEEDISVDDWMARRSVEILQQKLKQRTTGGVPLPVINTLDDSTVGTKEGLRVTKIAA